MSHHQDIEAFLQSLKTELSSYEAKHELVQTLIREELEDIETALSKCRSGSFGECQATGAALPAEWLQEVPTLQTPGDWQKIWAYGKVCVPFDYRLH
ncbi:hypothetical protein [Heyndrickxia acidiproducens]|uniref:hypothetical protein n=1 Tax=Heyndrickxia acidiproducens TaxID=1121084 RepID=UPI00037DB49F|nr:hypothetical protein [Heyndrickxia acidiproducens]